ncbi:Imm53 family immunity protein [Burkholderia ambifaria]|uniref:Imm53 family immunity protein n=1 Tax=Burkholderia ambifaria TaxID=152480 RepID=UPI00158AD94D|nr:immunity 53 family protein [Burkholderia ambifaria]UEP51763.1 immunity 53 family protein [Burkholderia ambifaria]
MSGLIIELQRWYMFQCDEVWEHSYGVEICQCRQPPCEPEVHSGQCPAWDDPTK